MFRTFADPLELCNLVNDAHNRLFEMHPIISEDDCSFLSARVRYQPLEKNSLLLWSPPAFYLICRWVVLNFHAPLHLHIVHTDSVSSFHFLLNGDESKVLVGGCSMVKHPYIEKGMWHLLQYSIAVCQIIYQQFCCITPGNPRSISNASMDEYIAICSFLWLSAGVKYTLLYFLIIGTQSRISIHAWHGVCDCRHYPLTHLGVQRHVMGPSEMQ